VERARSSSNPVNSEDRAVAPTPSRARGGEDPDDIERKVIYKKRARRRRKEYDDEFKPMRIIELSADKKSHASSISEGSGTNDDDDDDESSAVFARRRNLVGDGGDENGMSSSRVKE
jgi:hypothetical protein